MAYSNFWADNSRSISWSSTGYAPATSAKLVDTGGYGLPGTQSQISIQDTVSLSGQSYPFDRGSQAAETSTRSFSANAISHSGGPISWMSSTSNAHNNRQLNVGENGTYSFSYDQGASFQTSFADTTLRSSNTEASSRVSNQQSYDFATGARDSAFAASTSGKFTSYLPGLSHYIANRDASLSNSTGLTGELAGGLNASNMMSTSGSGIDSSTDLSASATAGVRAQHVTKLEGREGSLESTTTGSASASAEAYLKGNFQSTQDKFAMGGGFKASAGANLGLERRVSGSTHHGSSFNMMVNGNVGPEVGANLGTGLARDNSTGSTSLRFDIGGKLFLGLGLQTEATISDYDAARATTMPMQAAASGAQLMGQAGQGLGQVTETASRGLEQNQKNLDAAVKATRHDPLANVVTSVASGSNRVLTNVVRGADGVVDATSAFWTGTGKKMQNDTNQATARHHNGITGALNGAVKFANDVYRDTTSRFGGLA